MSTQLDGNPRTTARGRPAVRNPKWAYFRARICLLGAVSTHFAVLEPLYDRALAINEKPLGPELSDVATSLDNLASMLTAKKPACPVF
jgi:hypothetical protein